MGTPSARAAPLTRSTLAAAILACTTVAVSGCSAHTDPTVSPTDEGALQRLPAGERARVDRVVDGDTVIVDGERVRLIGIDAPESVKPGSPVACYGPEASARLHELLPPRTPVLLEYDVDREDRYDRVLAYIWLPDPPRLVNLVLVREGFARAYAVPPDTAHQAAFDAAETAAAAADRGLWADCH